MPAPAASKEAGPTAGPFASSESDVKLYCVSEKYLNSGAFCSWSLLMLIMP
jgi:hypothetical protein